MINCGHSRYMFVPGLSKKREMDFTKKENDEAYIEKQRQRQYERTIRNKKREIAMLKQTGAEESYIKRKQNSLSDTRKEYLGFLDKTGRTRITANEWIGSTSLSSKAKERTTKSYQSWKIKEEKKKLPKVVKSDDTILQSKIDYDIMGIQGIVPSNTTITNVHIIAGKDSSVNIRDRNKIVEKYNVNATELNKKVGVVEGKYHDYEIHWYEANGLQLEAKLKNKPKERK